MSIGREWTLVSILSFGDASKDVFVISGMFEVNGCFSALYFLISILL